MGETEEGTFGDGYFGGFGGFLDTRTSGFQQRGEEDFGNFGGLLSFFFFLMISGVWLRDNQGFNTRKQGF